MLPNMNADVRLSAPVLRDIYEVPENSIWKCWIGEHTPATLVCGRSLTVHQPQVAMIAEPRQTTKANAPTEVVLYDGSEIIEVARVRGVRRGCDVLLALGSCTAIPAGAYTRTSACI